MKFIDLFSGCGGLAKGLIDAGFELELCVEADHNSCASIKFNCPDWNLMEESVRNIDFTCYRTDGIDLVSCTLPCQPYANYTNIPLKKKKRGEAMDDKNMYFFDFCRAVKEIDPKIFLIENVKLILTHENGLTFECLQDKLDSMGYKIYHKVLNAYDYGVAQKRERLFIVGIRDDIHDRNERKGNKFRFIQPTSPIDGYKNLRDVIGGDLCADDNGDGKTYSESKYKIMNLIPSGGCWIDLPKNLQKEYLGNTYSTPGGKRGIAKRLSWDAPSPTLTTSPCQKQTERCHPSETRPITVYEYKLIQSFPKNWQFAGPVANQYKQIGMSVPPTLAKHVGRSLSTILTGRIASNT